MEVVSALRTNLTLGEVKLRAGVGQVLSCQAGEHSQEKYQETKQMLKMSNTKDKHFLLVKEQLLS